MNNSLSVSKFNQLFREQLSHYEATNNPEILEHLIQITEQQVRDEKKNHELWHLALSRLEQLESITDLPPLLLYRKAVLFKLTHNFDESLALFNKVIESEEADQYLKDRSCGYLLLYFDQYITINKGQKLFEELRKTQDPTALNFLEQIQFRGDFSLNDEDDLYRDEDTYFEEEHVIFTSDDRVKRSIRNKMSKASFRMGHTPQMYNLYIDQVQEKYYINGKQEALKNREVAALFTMALKGQECQPDEIYSAVYGEDFKFEDSRIRSTLQQFMSRLRRKFHGKLDIDTYSLGGRVYFCLIYKKHWEEDLLSEID
jgi:hypothetical protein